MPRLPWFKQHPHPLVIAHRGSSLDAPENTLAAFLLAVEQGADAVELDVAVCASGDLVVIHDSTVNRTTSGSGKVTDLPLREIKSFDSGSWFNERFKGEPIPTLNEVFETIGRKCLINVELKNFRTPFDTLADQVAQLVIRHNLQQRVFFSSFNPLNFRKIKRLLPETPVGLLIQKGKTGQVMLRISRWIGPFDSLHPHFADINSPAIIRQHRTGMPLFPYTVNAASDIEAMRDAGVSGVITDNPVLAGKILRRKQAA